MNNSASENLLGLDFGLKHIGVAVAVVGLPQPHTTLANNQQLFQKIQDIVTTHKISKVVIGISDGKMLISSKQFGEELKNELGLPVVYVDESLSSVEAALRMRWQKNSQRQRRPLHEVAAAIILETYLDEASSFREN